MNWTQIPATPPLPAGQAHMRVNWKATQMAAGVLVAGLGFVGKYWVRWKR